MNSRQVEFFKLLLTAQLVVCLRGHYFRNPMLYPFERPALVESIALAPIASTVTSGFVQLLCGFPPEYI
jgi:hypothetical protein